MVFGDGEDAAVCVELWAEVVAVELGVERVSELPDCCGEIAGVGCEGYAVEVYGYTEDYGYDCF